MAKYSYEFKKKIVKAYLEGKGGCGYLANQYGIPNKCIVRRWIKAYETLGDEGLKRSRKNEESCISRTWPKSSEWWFNTCVVWTYLVFGVVSADQCKIMEAGSVIKDRCGTAHNCKGQY